MTLAEMQSKFQAGILEDDQTILASIAGSRRTDRATLFAVYHDAYRMRLAEFLSNDYPILRERLGDETFGRLVEDYILSAPSRQRNARWYGALLPDFMRESVPWRENREAVDLALFERALNDAFDAADAPAWSMEAFADIGSEDWPGIVFEFHPSFSVLDLGRGTAGIYAALIDHEAPPTIGQGIETIVFWRNDGQSLYRLVAEDERLALLEAQQGKEFSDICALLAFRGGNEDVTARAAGLLSQWLADGLVTRLSIRD